MESSDLNHGLSDSRGCICAESSLCEGADQDAPVAMVTPAGVAKCQGSVALSFEVLSSAPSPRDSEYRAKQDDLNVSPVLHLSGCLLC